VPRPIPPSKGPRTPKYWDVPQWVIIALGKGLLKVLGAVNAVRHYVDTGDPWSVTRLFGFRNWHPVRHEPRTEHASRAYYERHYKGIDEEPFDVYVVASDPNLAPARQGRFVGSNLGVYLGPPLGPEDYELGVVAQGRPDPEIEALFTGPTVEDVTKAYKAVGLNLPTRIRKLGDDD